MAADNDFAGKTAIVTGAAGNLGHAIVDAFVAAHPDFVQSDVTAELAKAGINLDTGPSLRLLPHRHGCDGFFAAILERTK